MDQSDYATSGKPSPTRRELQGPRPTPLKVSKDSYKIKKPPVAPPPSQPQGPAPRQSTTTQDRQPLIFYSVSPKVIHTTVSDFRNLVQRLTGSSSISTDAATSSGDLSSAARLAFLEKTSPSNREKEREKAADLVSLAEGTIEVGQMPGILSPSPATLPPISPGFFSPGSDANTFSLLHDLSPVFNGSNNMFIPSPSTLFSTPLVSPSPSSSDFFNHFWDS